MIAKFINPTLLFDWMQRKKSARRLNGSRLENRVVEKTAASLPVAISEIPVSAHQIFKRTFSDDEHST